MRKYFSLYFCLAYFNLACVFIPPFDWMTVVSMVFGSLMLFIALDELKSKKESI